MELPLAALAWLLAMAAVALWDAPGWLFGTAVALAAPVAALRWGRSGLVFALVVGGVAVVGGLRYEQWAEAPPPSLAEWVGSDATIVGTIRSEPDPGRTTVRYRLDAEQLEFDGTAFEVDGAVLITVGEYVRFRPGDGLRVSGEIEEPPVFEDFDYRGYLARRGIVGTMLFPAIEVMGEGSRWSYERQIAEVRLALEDALQRALPEPEASLAAGIAYGRDQTLPDDLYDDFRTSGLAHIVAVSGSNVAYVTALVFLVCVRFMRRLHAVVPAAMTLGAYVAVAGAEASVLRAGLMALVFLVGLLLGRPQSSLAALAAAAIAMTFVQPSAVHEAGFQLSFAATAGLITFGPWIQYGLDRGLTRMRVRLYVPDLALQAASLTLAATVATLPITWTTFGRVSVVGVVTNIVVEPLFMVAFWLSVAASLAGVAWEPAGWAIGLAAYYPLAFIAWLASASASLPGAAIDLPRASGEQALVLYLVFAAAAWPAYRYLVPHNPQPERPPHVRTFHRVAIAGGVGALAVVVLPVSLLPLRPAGELRVEVLDVGQGDAILLTTPNGTQVLVDGGPSGIELARELGSVLPHWDRTLDLLVLTHPDQDHLGGLIEALRRYDTKAVADTGVPHTSALFGLFEEEAPGRVSYLRGESWEVDGVRFEVLWPETNEPTRQTNNQSLVLRVSFEGVTLLLTGDIEAPAQRALLASDDLRAHVLHVPHHGSKTSEPAFLAAVEPAVAFISVGADNRYGHPHEETLAALDGVPVYRTDVDGRITLRVRGGRVTVSTER